MVVQAYASKLPRGPRLENIQSWQWDQALVWPVTLDPRDGGLISFNKQSKKLEKSLDDGLTYAPLCDFAFPPSLTVLRAGFTPDGEMVVATSDGWDETNAETGSTVWRSTGWATNPKTASFKRSLNFQKKTSISYGGFGVEGNVVVASEYGPTTNNPLPHSRYAYLSRDGGRTFSTVFDLDTTIVSGQSEPIGNPSKVQHLHGVAYDPYWQRIWLPLGDATAGAVTVVLYSDDWGRTWQEAKDTRSTLGHWQPLLPAVTKNSVVLGTDFDMSGVRQFRRLGYRQPGPFEAAHIQDGNSGIQLIGYHAFRRQGMPGAPLLITSGAVGAKYAGAVAATFDEGLTWVTIYQDTYTGTDPKGLSYSGCVESFGPTNTGRYVVFRSDKIYNQTGLRVVGSLTTDKPDLPPVNATAEQQNMVVGVDRMKTIIGTSGGGQLNAIPTATVGPNDLTVLSAVVHVPMTWNSYTMQVVWAPNSATNGGAVRFGCGAISMQKPPLTGAAPTVYYATTPQGALPDAPAKMQFLDIGPTIQVTNSNRNTVVSVRRDGPHAEDTHIDPVQIVGVRLIKAS